MVGEFVDVRGCMLDDDFYLSTHPLPCLRESCLCRFHFPRRTQILPAWRYSKTAFSSPPTANCLLGPSEPICTSAGCQSNAQAGAARAVVYTADRWAMSHSLTFLSAPLWISFGSGVIKGLKGTVSLNWPTVGEEGRAREGKAGGSTEMKVDIRRPEQSSVRRKVQHPTLVALHNRHGAFSWSGARAGSDVVQDNTGIV